MAECIVLDSSVAVKWYLRDEPDAEVAEEILLDLLAEDLTAHVPDVLFYEVAHAMTKAAHPRGGQGAKPRIDVADVRESVEKLFELPLVVHPLTRERCEAAVTLAVENSKQHADMVFLDLARETGCRLCTADERLLIATPSNYPREHIVLLPVWGAQP